MYPTLAEITLFFFLLTYQLGDAKFPLDLTSDCLSFSDVMDVDKNNIAEFKSLFSTLLEFCSLNSLTNFEVLGLVFKSRCESNYSRTPTCCCFCFDVQCAKFLRRLRNCKWATCTDWHVSKRAVTPVTTGVSANSLLV